MAGIEEEAADNILVDRTSDLGSRIQMSLDFLCENSTNHQEVLIQLFSKGLLSQRESLVIENEKSNYDSFRQLFTFLIPRLGHGNNAQHFVDAFQQSGNEHILKELKSAVVAKYFAPGLLDTSSHKVRFNVQEQVSSFVGRENFLRDLHKQILQSQKTVADVSTNSTIISRICVVTGLGGIGKTETIRKYIQSYGHCYQNVAWIDAEDHNTAENQFRRLALELQLPSKDFENKVKDIDDLLKDIYDRLCTSHTLFVLDNAEALHDSDPQRHGIARFLPTTPSLTLRKPVIIITSRHQDWPDLYKLPLPLLTSQESSAFILYQLNLKECESNRKEITTLSETFDGLPLALQAAAAFIRQKSEENDLMGKDVYTIQHLLSDYNQEKRKVLEKRPPGSPDTQPLMFLWKVSLDKIRQQPHGHLATHILNVMAHLSPKNIPKDLLSYIFKSYDKQSFAKAVALLVDYSFVHDSDTHFSIHRMLQDVTLAYLEEPAKKHPKEEGLLVLTPPLIPITTALKKYWPTIPKSSKAFDAVHDNLVHVTMSQVLPKAQNPSETDSQFIEFLEFVFEEIKNTRWMDAEKCCRVLINYFTYSALPFHSATFFESPNFKKVNNFQLKLAWILREMGRYKEAVDICQELLSSYNSLENQEDVMEEILDTKHRLASILDSQGEHEEAIKLYSSVLDLRSKLHGPTHKFTLTTKYNLATALQKSGRLSEAKTLYTEIIDVEMKDHGQLHPPTLATKLNMANILADEGGYDATLEMLRDLEEVRERELGPFHADKFTSKNCMADVLYEQGKLEDALRIYACRRPRHQQIREAYLRARCQLPRMLQGKKQHGTYSGEAGEVGRGQGDALPRRGCP